MVKKGEFVDYKVDPTGSFKKALRKAGKISSDLRVPFKLITMSFYRTNKVLFTLKSKGPFDDLSNNYKEEKAEKYGFIYPILKATGALERSITNPTDSNTVASVLNKTTLILGTKLTSKKGAPYPAFLQFGTKFMPARPYLVVGTEKGRWAQSKTIRRRKQRWIEVLGKYCADSLRKGK